MAVENLVSLAWLRYHGVVDTSLPFRERTYPIIYRIFRYSHRKGPEDLPTENQGLSFQDIFFSIAVWSYCWQVWKIQSKKNHANLMKHAPILRFPSILTQKKHSGQKMAFPKLCVVLLFFRDMFLMTFRVGWDAPLPYPVFVNLARCCCTSLWHLRVSGVRKVPERHLQLESVFLYPNFIPTCGETLGITLSWVFHSILSHLVNLVKVSDSGRIHSPPKKPSTRLERGYFPRTGMHRLVEKKRHGICSLRVCSGGIFVNLVNHVVLWLTRSWSQHATGYTIDIPMISTRISFPWAKSFTLFLTLWSSQCHFLVIDLF